MSFGDTRSTTAIVTHSPSKCGLVKRENQGFTVWGAVNFSSGTLRVKTVVVVAGLGCLSMLARGEEKGEGEGEGESDVGPCDTCRCTYTIWMLVR